MRRLPGHPLPTEPVADHGFSSRAIYEERTSSFCDSGSRGLANDGKTLLLHGRGGAQERFVLRNAHTLRKLDPSGHEIESKPNYALKRLPTFVPIEPRSPQGSATSLENTSWKLI